ncbi:MAG: DUF4203 domain-containing protein [Propionibacteriaceae bacterium]|nr:DUF4203 domain-containing protein [Propionibacteriaceae bacterium]
MSGFAVGAIAFLAGFVLCFLGRSAARIIMSMWGVFVGLATGGAIASAITGDSPLSTVLGWVVGILLGLLLGSLAYSFYSLAVAIVMGSIGYGFGAAIAVWLGGGATVVHIVGIIAGVLLAIAALVTNLPDALLIVLTASSGAAAMAGGIMLMLGVAVTSDFMVSDARTVVIQQRWWWVLLYGIAVVAGILVQSRSRRAEAIRNSWPHPVHP